MQKCLDLLTALFARFALKVNITKTETQISSYNSIVPTSLIQLNDIDIKNTDRFKYLGAQITTNELSTGWTELNHRIQSAQCQFAQRIFENSEFSKKFLPFNKIGGSYMGGVYFY